MRSTTSMICASNTHFTLCAKKEWKGAKWNVHTCFILYRCWSWRRTYIHADIHIYNCINMLQIWISDLNIQQFYGRGFYEGWHKQFFMLKGINMLNFNNISFICILHIHIMSYSWKWFQLTWISNMNVREMILYCYILAYLN